MVRATVRAGCVGAAGNKGGVCGLYCAFVARPDSHNRGIEVLHGLQRTLYVVRPTMIEQLTNRMELYSNSLQLRSLRQQVIASNMANVDTPGYVGRDFDFAKALKNANSQQKNATTTLRTSGSTALSTTDTGHLRLVSHVNTTPAQEHAKMAYNVQIQPSADGNSVDMDQQRANFTDNAIRYESTLRFITGHVKTMLSAIQGQ